METKQQKQTNGTVYEEVRKLNVFKAIDDFLSVHQNKNVLVAFDYSGSMNSTEVTETFHIIVDHIKKTHNLTVVFTDTDILWISSTQNFVIVPFEGGGSDFEKPFEWAIKKGYDAVIYLTDGFSMAPHNEPLPTLWLIDENNRGSADYLVSKEDLKKINWGQFVAI
jgi:predicted metal-dependent peptidase